MRKFDFSYDEENDDLFLFRENSKSKGGVEFGKDIVLDFNNSRELVGIEILNATETLAELAPVRKEFAGLLSSLKNCRVDIREKAGIIIIKMFLVGRAEEAPAMITIPSLMRHN